MKIVKLSFVLMLYTTIAFSQEVSFERPDFSTIDKSIKDKKSGFYYNDLLNKLKNRDTTFSTVEFKHLYFGRLLQKDYSPFERSDKDEEIFAYFRKENLSESDYPVIIDLITKDLEIHPFDLRKMNFLIYIYHLSKRDDEAKKLNYFFRGFINTILSSGDGKTCETGLVVNEVSHEYVLLNLFQLEQESQSLTGNCDYQSFEKGKYKIDGLYFSIDKILEAEQKTLFGK